MERTELRGHLAALNALDPWTRMVQHAVADAWVQGYEQAMREAIAELKADAAPVAAGTVDRLLHSRSWPDRRHAALEHLTDERRRSEVEAIVALACLGSMLPAPGPLSGAGQ